MPMILPYPVLGAPMVGYMPPPLPFLAPIPMRPDCFVPTRGNPQAAQLNHMFHEANHYHRRFFGLLGDKNPNGAWVKKHVHGGNWLLFRKNEPGPRYLIQRNGAVCIPGMEGEQMIMPPGSIYFHHGHHGHHH